jgi:hypothetical protein
MTIIVGVRCSDGVVLGVDSASTNSAGPMPLLRMGSDKLQVVGDRVLFATTGSVGLSQRFCDIIKSQYDKKMFSQQDAVTGGKTLAKEMVQDMRNTGIPMHPQNGWGFGALLAAEFKDNVELIEFSTTDFQPEIKKGKLFFASLGSGQTLADPFLSFVCRVLWESKAPSIDVARFGIHWALNHTIECAPGFVGEPIKLGVFGRNKGSWQTRLLEEPELTEQKQFIMEIEKYLRQYKTGEVHENEGAAPEPPPEPPKRNG